VLRCDGITFVPCFQNRSNGSKNEVGLAHAGADAYKYSKIVKLLHSDARAAYRTRVMGVVRRADEGWRMSVQRVSSLSENTCLCSYVPLSFLQSESDDNRIFHNYLHGILWFPLLHRVIV
jgi:hypothetical protein